MTLANRLRPSILIAALAALALCAVLLLPAQPAEASSHCVDTDIWCATMTAVDLNPVDDPGGTLGYNNGGFYLLQNGGSLSSTTFTHDGTTYTVESVVWFSNDPQQPLFFTLDPAPTVANSPLVLDVGGTPLAFSDLVEATADRGHYWSSPGVSYSTGSVELRIPKEFLVSNSGQTDAGTSTLNNTTGAVGFTTGSNDSGYSLTGVSLDFNSAHTSGGDAAVSLWDSHTVTISGNDVEVPNGEMFDFTSPGSISAGLNEFSAPEGHVLDPDTTYFMVIRRDATNALVFNGTDLDDEDTGGGAGWTIADKRLHRDRGSTGAWSSATEEDRQLRVQVHGSNVPPPPPVPVTVAVLTVADISGAQDGSALGYSESIGVPGGSLSSTTFTYDGTVYTVYAVGRSDNFLSVVLGPEPSADHKADLVLDVDGTPFPFADIATDIDRMDGTFSYSWVRTQSWSVGDTVELSVTKSLLSATLTVADVKTTDPGSNLGYNDGGASSLTDGGSLTTTTFDHGGTTHTIKSLFDEASGSPREYYLKVDPDIDTMDSDLVFYFDGTAYAHADASTLATVGLMGYQTWLHSDVGTWWAVSDEVDVLLTAPGGVWGSAVRNVEITSDPTAGAGSDTYALGEEIEVTVDTGVGASLDLQIGSDVKQAAYTLQDPPDSRELVFVYSVAPGDEDADGIAVVAGSLQGGITSDEGIINLANPELSDDSGHKVDANLISPVWSATLTPKETGTAHLGCVNSHTDANKRCSDSTVLSDDDFTVGSSDYTINSVYLSNGTLTVAFIQTLTGDARKLALQVGSSDTLAFTDADTSGGNFRIWRSTGLSWTADVDVPLSLTLLPIPGRPEGLSATPGDGEVTLAWTAGNDGGSAVTKHQYRQKEGSGSFGGWTDIPNSAPSEANATSYTVTGLTNGTAHTFQVRAVSAEGNGVASNEAGATPAAIDMAPAGLWNAILVVKDVGTVALGCDNVNSDTNKRCSNDAVLSDDDFTVGTTDYSILWITLDSTGNLQFQVSGVLAGDAERLTLHVGSSDSLDFEYADFGTNSTRIWNATGLSWTANTAVSLSLTLPPGAPQGLTASPDDGQATLSWIVGSEGGDAITKHQYRQQEGSGTFGGWTDITDSAPGGVNESSYTVTGLTDGTAYTFQVRAVNGQGDGVESEEASVTPPDGSHCDGSETWCATLTAADISPPGDAIFGYNDGGTTAQDGGALSTATFDYEGTTHTITTLLYDDDNDELRLHVNPAPPEELTHLYVNGERYALADAVDNNGLIWTGQTAWGDRDLVQVALVEGLPGFWSVTLTPQQFGANTVGCDNDAADSSKQCSNEDVLSDDEVTVAGRDYTVKRILLEDAIGGFLKISFEEDLIRVAERLLFNVGGDSFDFDDPFTSNSSSRAWRDTRLSWTAGTPVPLSLMRPTNIEPVFPYSTLSFLMAENIPGGVRLGTVTASDEDGDPLTYSLEGPDVASFTIDPASGEIRTRVDATYDYETQPLYEFMAKAEDGQGGSDTVEVTVNLQDRDEPPAAPDAPTVVPHSVTAIRATWREPENTGPPITGYDVQYRTAPGGSPIAWASGIADTSAIIGGLSKDNEYQVRVRARNDEGTGDWSDWSAPESPGVIWSGTLTPQDLGVSRGLGCDSDNADTNKQCSNSSVLDDDDLTVDGAGYSITRISLTSGGSLWIELDSNITGEARKLALNVGSSDSFAFVDANDKSSAYRVWDGTGLS